MPILVKHAGSLMSVEEFEKVLRNERKQQGRPLTIGQKKEVADKSILIPLYQDGKA